MSIGYLLAVGMICVAVAYVCGRTTASGRWPWEDPYSPPNTCIFCRAPLPPWSWWQRWVWIGPPPFCRDQAACWQRSKDRRLR